MTTLNAVTAEAFTNSLGINTHIDSFAYGYQNLGVVAQALQYLGVTNVRDSAQNGNDANLWQQVAQAAGVKFDDYVGETSPGGMQADIGLVQQLAQEGILNFVEGGNEEDTAYPASLGNTLGYTAQFQQTVAAIGHSLGLGVINMSFGAGWTAANNWHGNYDKVGDLSASADYANAHTYPGVGQTPDYTLQLLNGDAQLAAAGRPVINTEMGWDNNSFSPGATAQYVVQAALDGMREGDVKTYFYALFDDNAGAFGLMNPDGSAKPAGAALHNLTSLLSDSGSAFTPGSLSFTLDGAQSTDNTLLLQKSDGSDWLAVWNESAAPHTITLGLPAAAAAINVFDPVTGTSAIASANNAGSISASLGNDPLLFEVVPAGGLTGAATAASLQGIAAFDTTTNQATTVAAQPYSGPVSGLQNQSINVTADSLNISVDTPNWFIYAGGPNDAITVLSGTNVLEAGSGSNFLTGGSGSDTFYVDDRNPAADTWTTVSNFHPGDAVTIWGVTPQDFNLGWVDGEGAAGYTGLTLHATAQDRPTASLTLAGYTQADLSNGRLAVTFGNVGGSDYMYVQGK